MKAAAVDILLALAVLCAWIGAVGFVRLGSALDRLHAPTFVLVSSGGLLTLASLLQDGISSRSLKLAFLFVALLVIGAATSHAVGRALFTRDGERA